MIFCIQFFKYFIDKCFVVSFVRRCFSMSVLQKDGGFLVKSRSIFSGEKLSSWTNVNNYMLMLRFWLEMFETLRTVLHRIETHAYPQHSSKNSDELKLARWMRQQYESHSPDARPKEGKKLESATKRVELLEALPGWTWPTPKSKKGWVYATTTPTNM